MNIDELTYNPFDRQEYEHFLLEVFNINLADRNDLSYLYSDKSNILDLSYYGSYLDDDFNEIELYVIQLGDIDEYKEIQDVIFNQLSLNQTNHAYITVYSKYTNRWFYSYLFLEYIVQDNKLVNYKAKIDDYIHWCGSNSSDNQLSQMLSMKISTDNIKSLLRNTQQSYLILALSKLLDELNSYQTVNATKFDSYKLLIKVLIHIINHNKPKSTLMLKVYDRILEISRTADEDITTDTVYELYNYLNNQETIPKTLTKSVCEDTLIEYLSSNTIISVDDISIYVKYAYSNRKLIIKHIGEALQNDGRSFTNMRIPLSIIYNIDSINTLLEKIKILDFSINSTSTITTFTYLISTLKYTNRLIQGYTDVSLDEIFKTTLKNNIYMITLNKQSYTTAKAMLKGDLNLLYTDALNLYPEYTYFSQKLKHFNPEDTKTEIINTLVDNYNRTHFHDKININFEENFRQKNGYIPLIYTLDYKEVFKDNHKFDIIISNIEHVDLTGNKEYKKQLKRYKIYDNTQRYEYYFIEKALDIIDDHGIITLIIDNQYKTQQDQKISKLLNKTQIIQQSSQYIIYKKK